MDDVSKLADKDGHFKRPESQFRDRISPDPTAKFPAERDRYVLYINWGCPWAHRANIVRSLKGLEDVLQLAVMDAELTSVGWTFTGRDGSDAKDPLYGFTEVRQLYFKADPNYSGRYTVPFIWDKKNETLVNNESSEIIRMLYSAFDAFIPAHKREINHPGGGLLPDTHHKEIDEMNNWVYDKINNGVYKAGFATTQEAYLANVQPLFQALDRIEDHLSQLEHSPYLFGKYITEADIRLYTTMIRFDTSYYTLFKCNLKMVRQDYPHIHDWLRRLYWDESDETQHGAFKKTTCFEIFKRAYAAAGKSAIVPAGPLPHILPLQA